MLSQKFSKGNKKVPVIRSLRGYENTQPHSRMKIRPELVNMQLRTGMLLLLRSISRSSLILEKVLFKKDTYLDTLAKSQMEK